jgi:hypothetical protein
MRRLINRTQAPTFAKAVASAHMSWREAFAISLLALPAACAAVAALYLLKSAAGINLTSGPSLLHDTLYALIR